MNAILMKDLLLTWMTFRKYIYIGFFLILAGFTALMLYSTSSNDVNVKEASGTQQFGLVSAGLPNSISESLNKTSELTTKVFEDIESLKSAVRDKKIKYGVYVSEDGDITLALESGASIISLIKKRAVRAYFEDMSGPIEFVSVTEDRPERFQSYMIWFAFISLLMIGNSLCNILVWEERSKGTLEELVAAPINRLEILLAKLLSVLLSTLVLCVGMVLAILGTIIAAATAIILNSENLKSFFMNLSSGNQSKADEATAIDVASSFVGWADVSLIGMILGTAFFALLALTTTLVVVNFVVKQQATLKFLVTPVVLAIYGIPFVIDFDVASSVEWLWMVPIANIYFTSAFAALNEMSVLAWLPALSVNVISWFLVLCVGVFMIGRIQDWPSR